MFDNLNYWFFAPVANEMKRQHMRRQLPTNASHRGILSLTSWINPLKTLPCLAAWQFSRQLQIQEFPWCFPLEILLVTEALRIWIQMTRTIKWIQGVLLNNFSWSGKSASFWGRDPRCSPQENIYQNVMTETKTAFVDLLVNENFYLSYRPRSTAALSPRSDFWLLFLLDEPCHGFPPSLKIKRI